MPNLETQQDIARGLEALQFFHNASVEYSGYPYRTTEDLAKALSKLPVYNFADGFGFSVNSLLSTGVYDISDVRTAMQALARDAQGRVPTASSFISAIGKIPQGDPSLIKAIGFTVKESAKDIGKGAQVVGNAVIATGASLATIGPLLVVAGIIMYAYLRIKRTA